jgi:hypothetical protein
LAEFGLLREENGRWRRVIIEKPFGHDLDSARQLNSQLIANINISIVSIVSLSIMESGLGSPPRFVYKAAAVPSIPSNLGGANTTYLEGLKLPVPKPLAGLVIRPKVRFDQALPAQSA